MTNSTQPKHGLARIAAAGVNSIAGLRAAWREEAAFRQELMLAAVALPVAVWLPVTTVEKLLLAASVILVLIVEVMNSAIEAAVDRISLERHELSKRAKDLGSAAVMLALLLAIITWSVIVPGVFLRG